MILWSIAAGALIGWSMADFSEFGLVFGGMIGAVMGGWLRSAMCRGKLCRHMIERWLGPVR